ncbi:MAG: alpha-E domain-containing protein [Gammaproteobacteria bacterium]|nr:alpha-E domain-containing protein [Gammaproteobacteria bacterium]
MAKERLLSRVAERMYWLGRYLERTENTARLLNVYGNLLYDLPRNVDFGWASLIDIFGATNDFSEHYSNRDERNVVKFMIADEWNPTSTATSVHLARENARASREGIPQVAFETINVIRDHVQSKGSASLGRRSRGEFCAVLVKHCQLFTGQIQSTMSYDAAYQFLRLGQSIERADMTSRIIDTGYATEFASRSDGAAPAVDETSGVESALWMSVLRSVSALQMYRRHYQERIEAADVVEFLLKNEDFPRSLTCCLGAARFALGKLPENKRILAMVYRANSALRRGDTVALMEEGMREFIDEFQLNLEKVHTRIDDAWFSPARPRGS